MSPSQESSAVPEYFPFFDPGDGGKALSWPAKIGISVGLGLAYGLLQLLSLSDKTVFIAQYCWVLSIIITTSLLALYVATLVFRQCLRVLFEFEAGSGTTAKVINSMLTDKAFLIFAAVFATLTTGAAHTLGIPADLHESPLALAVNYLGYFMASFSSGLGTWAIFGVITLYLRFAPNLQFTIDPQNPDGNGGIKLLGESLWFFALLIAVIGLLVAGYMFSVEWTNLRSPIARAFFLIWLALPFTLAVSVILIPGLAVRRQIDQYKARRFEELKKERANAYASFKEFEADDDDSIISAKRELNDKIHSIQDELDKLERMRNSPLDGRGASR